MRAAHRRGARRADRARRGAELKRCCLVFAAFFAWSGPPALAQTTTPFETQATSLAGACLGMNVAAETADQTIATCEKVVADIAALKLATPTLASHDLNVYYVVVSMAHSRIGSAYGAVDKVRSARVCQRVEMAWATTSKIEAGNSPAYARMIQDMVTASVSALTKCRSEFGAPAGAPALP
jgi:hypothetical protein